MIAALKRAQRQSIDRALLEVLRANRYGLTRAQLAASLYPRGPMPYSTAAERRAEFAARREHASEAQTLTRYAIDRAKRRGHIEVTRRITLDPSARAAIEAGGLAALRGRSHVEVDGEIVGVTVDASLVMDSCASRILLALVEHPEGLLPGRLSRLTGGKTSSGREVGHWREVMRRLEGVDVVPAGLWRLTSAGWGVL